MLLKNLLYALALSVVFSALPVKADLCGGMFEDVPEDFSQHHQVPPSQRVLYRYLSRVAQAPQADVPPGDLSQSEEGLRRLFLSTPVAEFNQLWATVSRQDIDTLAQLIASGTIRATASQNTRILALKAFIDRDERNVLW